MKQPKILLLALCLGGLTSSLGADSISNSVATTSPTTITENIVLPEFQYTLAQAKKAGYPKTVALIEAEDYDKALTQLETEFIKEPIEGYKKTFFTEVLEGICLEKSGQIVEAYRSYQNARYYYDAEKVRWLDSPFPAPRLEVLTAIGRMCNDFSRSNDALSYIDAARIEAAEYPSVAVAADYALINRSIKIGDFQEAIIMFEDLGTLTKLTRDDYNQYAKILLICNQNRQAFLQLLHGLATYGFDEKQGMKDPMIQLFIRALPRADDTEIKWFYDLLGFHLKSMDPVQQNEKFITEIIRTRKTLSTLLPFVDAEDDFAVLKDRVEVAKKMVKYVPAKRFKKAKLSLSKSTNRPSTISNKQKNRLALSNLEKLEDTLNTAGYFMGENKPSKLIQQLRLAGNIFTNLPKNEVVYFDDIPVTELRFICNTFAKAYDGNLKKEIWTKYCKRLQTSPLVKSSFGIQTIMLMSKVRLKYTPDYIDPIGTTDWAAENSPNKSNPLLLEIIDYKVEKAFAKSDITNSIRWAFDYKDRAGFMTLTMLSKVLAWAQLHGLSKESTEVALGTFGSFDPFTFLKDAYNYNRDTFWFREICRNTSGLAPTDQLQLLARMQLLAEIRTYLEKGRNNSSKNMLKKSWQYYNEMEPTERSLREYLLQEEWVLIQDLFKDTYLSKSSQPIHLFTLAESYFNCDNFDLAKEKIKQASKLLEMLQSELKIDKITISETFDLSSFPKVKEYLTKQDSPK